jgi:hypothetical protein
MATRAFSRRSGGHFWETSTRLRCSRIPDTVTTGSRSSSRARRATASEWEPESGSFSRATGVRRRGFAGSVVAVRSGFLPSCSTSASERPHGFTGSRLTGRLGKTARGGADRFSRTCLSTAGFWSPRVFRGSSCGRGRRSCSDPGPARPYTRGTGSQPVPGLQDASLHDPVPGSRPPSRTSSGQVTSCRPAPGTYQARYHLAGLPPSLS